MTEGTVFTMTPDGTLTTLYTFCQKEGCSDGAYPCAGLVQATNGNFYGTTSGSGGRPTQSPLGCGTVFKITPSGTLTTLYRFCAKGDCASGALAVCGAGSGHRRKPLRDNVRGSAAPWHRLQKSPPAAG